MSKLQKRVWISWLTDAFFCVIIIVYAISLKNIRSHGNMEDDMKHCFIINPYAGKGTSVEGLKDSITRVCTEKNVEFEIYLTKAVGDATDYVGRRVAKEPDEEYRIYACGGDGTLGEVVNGVMALSDPSRVSVGLIPVGTGNDFVRNFTEGDRFFDIADQLCAQTMPIDLLRCNEMYAINMVNIGFDCEVVVKTAALKRKKWIPSKMAYIAGLVVTLLKKPGVRMKLSCDGGAEEEKHFLLTTYANGSFCGGGFHSNPRSILTDGQMDALFVNNISRTRFVMLVGDYKKGTHLTPRFEKVLAPKKAERIDMVFDKETNVSVDGEVIRFRELHLSVAREALRFLVPQGSAYAKSKEAAEAQTV
jgi:YegS/Rv2252/BmrU family lipid kinase